MSSTEELPRKYRPTKFSDVVGQLQAVTLLQQAGREGRVPHYLLFTGPSGCGKTTLARIMKDKLRCSDLDWTELNTADFRGIDAVREIRDRVNLEPIGGKSRIWLVDECHALTKDAQNAFLKILEEPPARVYFFLCTTEPQKLLPTMVTRATEIKVCLLKLQEMRELVNRVAAAEALKLGDGVADAIVEAAQGSPRKALVLLGQVVGAEGEEDQLARVSAGVSSSQAIDVARLLIKPNPSWSEVAKLLKECEDEPETVRRVVLGYCKSVLLGGGQLAKRAYQIILCFEKPFYDSGQAGLAASCYEAIFRRD